MKTIVCVLCVLIVGCAALKKNVAPIAKDLVTDYCSQPVEARLLLREQINAAIAPSVIKLTCAGDAP